LPEGVPTKIVSRPLFNPKIDSASGGVYEKNAAMKTPTNILLLYIARAVRGFGDGFAVIILPAYLSAIGFGPVQIGFVAASALLGTALLTLAIGFLAPRYDLRNLLVAGAIAMALTGFAFPSFEHIAFVIAVAFVGTINPSTGDIGVLVPIEHAMLAHSVPAHDRTSTFARYSLIGALSMAAGALASALPDWLTLADISKVSAFRLMFFAYAVLGLVSAALYRRLPHARPGAGNGRSAGPARRTTRPPRQSRRQAPRSTASRRTATRGSRAATCTRPLSSAPSPCWQWASSRACAAGKRGWGARPCSRRSSVARC